jgi:hypothetical protein
MDTRATRLKHGDFCCKCHASVPFSLHYEMLDSGLSINSIRARNRCWQGMWNRWPAAFASFVLERRDETIIIERGYFWIRFFQQMMHWPLIGYSASSFARRRVISSSICLAWAAASGFRSVLTPSVVAPEKLTKRSSRIRFTKRETNSCCVQVG